MYEVKLEDCYPKREDYSLEQEFDTKSKVSAGPAGTHL